MKLAEKTNSGVEIRKTQSKGAGVFAIRRFEVGETVIVGRSVGKASERTIYTFQVGPDSHVLMDEPAVRINHSFEPNTGVRNNDFGGYDFVALSAISVDDEITFDYETTESDLTDEFRACCPSPPGRSIGNGRGFGSLTEEIRSRYGEYIADYLKKNSDTW